MATIKAIEAKSVHQIQSGQVIVDLCSVVKELVENGLDAGATSLEVRFKNNGLDSIEVQDNGSGISPQNYESVALKHHTSKLSTYDDLSSLQTFGFRGEALSSLCALSSFYIITAQADEAPKGNRLDFMQSGALRSTSVVACQKGTTVCVENLFEQLPVRRKELTKNVKREYGKVIGLLHAYACICTNVRFSVKNSMSKGKSLTVFATKANATTRENISNVYGAKTLSALVAFELDLDFQPTLTQMGRNDAHDTKLAVRGHISKPVFGEGRQTPDRQMFFVNGRPCGLPQIAKAINEVYKGFNVSQSPFVFADFQMDTNSYDVNVSPDKRTIMLHNSAVLIEKLKGALTELFENQDQTVPQSNIQAAKLTIFKQLNIQRHPSVDAPGDAGSRRLSRTPDSARIRDNSTSTDQSGADHDNEPNRVIHEHFRNQASTREETGAKGKEVSKVKIQKDKERRAETLTKALTEHVKAVEGRDEYDDVQEMQELDHSDASEDPEEPLQDIRVRDFNDRMAEQQRASATELSPGEGAAHDFETDKRAVAVDLAEQPNIVQNAFDRMRPKRSQAEIATITIGDKTMTTVVGTQMPKQTGDHHSTQIAGRARELRGKAATSAMTEQFSQGLRKFGAPGTQVEDETVSDDIEEVEEDKPYAASDHEEERSEEAENDTESTDAPPAKRQRSSEEMDSDPDYMDEVEKKAEEKAKVAALIRAAEESAAIPSKENVKRINKALKSGTTKDSTLTLSTDVILDLAEVDAQAFSVRRLSSLMDKEEVVSDTIETAQSEEERLSLTVSKHDFTNMHIIGQFNLGFILAVRPSSVSSITTAAAPKSHDTDELFIIDQHASDEKYNFERLQAETVVGNQRLVRPIVLDLTAVEEEIVLENLPALEKNGFIVDFDASGDKPVGQRCRLLTLPLSKEVIFDTRDLEELIHLLAESPSLSTESMSVPRPTKVRRMFAMRACRSSIMIGKTLGKRQMKGVLEHMGMIDKPWNCPHGRPTMRHLTTLGVIGGWKEGDGVVGLGEGEELETQHRRDIWRWYLQQ